MTITKSKSKASDSLILFCCQDLADLLLSCPAKCGFHPLPLLLSTALLTSVPHLPSGSAGFFTDSPSPLTFVCGRVQKLVLTVPFLNLLMRYPSSWLLLCSSWRETPTSLDRISHQLSSSFTPGWSLDPFAGDSLIYVYHSSLINSAHFDFSERSQIIYYLVFQLKSKDFSWLYLIQHFSTPLFFFWNACLLSLHSHFCWQFCCSSTAQLEALVPGWPSLPIPSFTMHSTKVRGMDTSPCVTHQLCALSPYLGRYCPL